MKKTLIPHLLFQNIKEIILFLFIIFPFSVFSQDYININRDLGPQADLIFGSKAHPDAESYTFDDGYYSEFRIEHPIFNRARFEYNSAEGLTLYTYYCDSAKKTEQNKERILEAIERYYGSRGKQTGSTLKFAKNNEYVLFTINHDSCQMTVYTFNTIKAVEEYDQFEKERVILTEGYTNNQFEDYVGNDKTGERRLSFKGLISAKTIRMYYTMLPKTVKAFKVRLDDSISITLKPKKRYNERYDADYVFDLPREIAERFYHCTKMTLIAQGKDSDEVEVPEQILYMFRIVYKAIY